MTGFECGDILLLKVFPYSDFSGSKKRPALVLADTGDRDLLVCRITSEPPRDRHDFEIAHWQKAGLLLPSVVRVSKMAALSRELVVKKIGRLGSPDRREIRSRLRKLFLL